MARYSKKAQEQVEKTMHREKKGTLRSGSGAKVKSRKQAIAIALSEAREKGYKVPEKKESSKKATPRKAAAKKAATKKTTTKKAAPKKAAAKKGTRKKATAKKTTA
ncbi:DUF6496 domain-containing protein [Chitinophaga defluvii]|uniref:DUF6496 domain-containing protein n=1 Tax=Chitinophaga defluvii TaxID=3163343 RepID=A0ABV2T2L8_9BACT